MYFPQNGPKRPPRTLKTTQDGPKKCRRERSNAKTRKPSKMVTLSMKMFDFGGRSGSKTVQNLIQIRFGIPQKNVRDFERIFDPKRIPREPDRTRTGSAWRIPRTTFFFKNLVKSFQTKFQLELKTFIWKLKYVCMLSY